MSLDQQFETGPRPLSPAEAAENSANLNHSFIPEVANDRQLRRLGLLRQIHPSLKDVAGVNDFEPRPNRLPLSGGLFIWSPKLLALPSYNYHAEIIEGEQPIIRVSSRSGDLLTEVTPEEFWVVDNALGGKNRVNQVGYLVDLDESGRRASKKLIRAYMGNKPDSPSNSQYARVEDLGLVGRHLFVMYVYSQQGSELLVVDQKQRALVKRVVEQPLSYERWGIKPPPQWSGPMHHMTW